MNEELKVKFGKLMYNLTKMAARNSFSEFIENVDLDEEEWETIKAELKENYDAKFYV